MKNRLLQTLIVCLACTWCLFLNTALAIEILGFTEITVTDSSGIPQTAFGPGNIITIEAAFTLDRPGIAILRGTVTGENWSEELLHKFRFGLAGEYRVGWTITIPATATGQAQVEVILFNPVQERIIRSAFFTVAPIEAEFVGSAACNLCHPDVYAAWKQTLHSPGIGCELCHGPGSEHVITQSPQLIVIDRSSELCGRCHVRNDGTVIEAESGFIKNQQQYNEFKATKHSLVTECTSCHNPHFSPSVDRKEAIKINCIECHASQRVNLNMEGIACEECHMPYAIYKSQSTGRGIYRKGDMRTHIVRIKTEADPEDMFLPGGQALHLDAQGAFITDNFACLGCHNGVIARFEDFESVRKTSTLVHY